MIVKALEIVHRRRIMPPRDRWWWRLRARNGELLATSEAYTTHAKALQTALALATQLRFGSIDFELVDLHSPESGGTLASLRVEKPPSRSGTSRP